MPQTEDVRYLMLVCICVSSIVTSYFDRFVSLQNVPGNALQNRQVSVNQDSDLREKIRKQDVDIKKFEGYLARESHSFENLGKIRTGGNGLAHTSAQTSAQNADHNTAENLEQNSAKKTVHAFTPQQMTKNPSNTRISNILSTPVQKLLQKSQKLTEKTSESQISEIISKWKLEPQISTKKLPEHIVDLLSPKTPTQLNPPPKSTSHETSSRATILFYCKPYPDFPERFAKTLKTCFPNDNCDIVYGYENNSQLKKADIVVFHPLHKCGISGTDQWFNRMNSIRRKNQLFVFFQMDSPVLFDTDHLKNYSGFFNATMSYRTDSDFLFPHFRFGPDLTDFRKNQKFEESEIQQKFDTSTSKPANKLGVVAIVSNCKSKFRSRIIRQLNLYVKFPDGSKGFDVYGSCSKKYQPTPSAHRNSSLDARYLSEQIAKNMTDSSFVDEDLLKDTISQYKFYLAVEHSQCKDLISDKMFQGIRNNAVSIVAGPSRVDYLKAFEQGADGDAEVGTDGGVGKHYLHVDDYKNVKDLARHLTLLIDPVNSKKYLELKRGTENLLGKSDHHENGVCRLCEVAKRLKTGEKMRFPVLQDIARFWFGDKTNPICKKEGE